MTQLKINVLAVVLALLATASLAGLANRIGVSIGTSKKILRPETLNITPSVKLQLANSNKAVMKLSDAVPLQTAAAFVSTGNPLSLTNADFDEDGTPDLLSGAAQANGGTLAVYRGNVKAIFPDSLNTKSDLPFFAAEKFLSLEIAPDFLAAGDFNADGHNDVVVASRQQSALYFLKGDGKGNFEPAQMMTLSGTVTTLATGEINRVDGLPDLAVGITSPAGAKMLLYASRDGALNAAPLEISLPDETVSIVFGHLTQDGYSDLAITAGTELVILEGREQTPVLTRKTLPFQVASLAVGRFTDLTRNQLALLSADGAVYVTEDIRPASTSVRQSIRGRNNWEARLLFAVSAEIDTIAKTEKQLCPVRLSASPNDDLLVLDRTSSQFQILTNKEAPQRTMVGLEGAGELVTALPMRLNTSGQTGLVVLRKNSPTPFVLTPEAAKTITVNTGGDGAGNCQTPNGNCTLRAAMNEANANAGIDTIGFNNTVVQTIALSQPLPPLTEAVTINGVRSNGDKTILTVTSTVPGAIFALDQRSSNSVVRGFDIRLNSLHPGIAINGGQGNIIELNIINDLQAKTGQNGIDLQNGADNNLLQGNVITGFDDGSSNTSVFGIRLLNSNGNRVEGNTIQSNERGIVIQNAANNIIGGTGINAGNRISANLRDGIKVIGANASGNIIQRNQITSNGESGIQIGEESIITPSVGLVGNSVLDNDIQNNTYHGIFIGYYSTRNKISRNKIATNGRLGINLSIGNGDLSGVTGNDTGDVDTGANDLQNYPVLTAALSHTTATTITGTLNSTANSQFTLEFFANLGCDPSGFGEGETFLTSTTIITNANGDAAFSIILPTAIPAGQMLTATATDAQGNTSEFSACQSVITARADLAITQAVTPNPATTGSTVTYNVTLTNNGPNSAVNATAALVLPPQLNGITCTAPLGLACTGQGNQWTVSAATLPVGTTTVTLRGTLPCLVEGATLTSSATITSATVDPNLSGNSSTVESVGRAGTAIPLLTYDGGGAVMTFGTVLAGIGSNNPPSSTFSLGNTGCLPMQLEQVTFARTGNVTNLSQLDDGRYFVLRVTDPNGTEVTLQSQENPDRTLFFPIPDSLRTLRNGGILRGRVFFNPPWPLFAGRFSQSGIGIFASNVLPEIITSQLNFNFIATDNPARGSVGVRSTASFDLVGRVSPAVQIIPRDGLTLPPPPALNAAAQVEASPLVILETIRGDFRVTVSRYDANLNIHQIVYQFYDTYGQVASQPIAIDLTDPIRQSGLLPGQPFTLLQSFTGAAGRPDVTRVQVTVKDGDGTTVTASSASSANAFASNTFLPESQFAQQTVVIQLPVREVLTEFPRRHNVKGRQ